MSAPSSGTTSSLGSGLRSVSRLATPSHPQLMHHRSVATERTGRSIFERTGRVSSAHRGQSRPVGRKRNRRTNGETSIAAHKAVTMIHNIVLSLFIWSPCLSISVGSPENLMSKVQQHATGRDPMGSGRASSWLSRKARSRPSNEIAFSPARRLNRQSFLDLSRCTRSGGRVVCV